MACAPIASSEERSDSIDKAGDWFVLVPVARLLLNILPNGLAYRATRALASRTLRPVIAPVEQAALEEGVELRLDDRLRAWAWGSGPLVVLVHGWNGRAAQMAPLAASVANAGFRAVAIEITGHGDSSSRRTEWRHFLRDIPDAVTSLGSNVFAFVAHSAGALTLMGVRYRDQVAANRYVLIAAPTHPFPAIVAISRRLAPRAAVMERYREYVAAQFGIPWTALEAGALFRGRGERMLLCYDELDQVVGHRDGDRIVALAPGATLRKSSGLGHVGVLSADPVMSEIVAFLCDRLGATDEPPLRAGAGRP